MSEIVLSSGSDTDEPSRMAIKGKDPRQSRKLYQFGISRPCSSRPDRASDLPMIVSVQSLAPPKIKKRRLSDLPNKKILSIESVVESIDACVKKYCRSDKTDAMVVDIDLTSDEKKHKSSPVVSHDGSSSDCAILSNDSPEEIVSPVVFEVEQDKIEKVAMKLSAAPTLDGSLKTVEEKRTNFEKIGGVVESSEDVKVTAAKECQNNSDEESAKAYDISPNTLLFRKFLVLCRSLEENMFDRQRLCDKLESNREKSSPAYIESGSFATLLKTVREKISKENLYQCVNEVLEELKSNRKRVPLKPCAGASTSTTTADNAASSERTLEINFVDEKLESEVKRLQNALEILSKRIKELEEQEVDLDDEEDSTYLKLQRYRKKFSKIYAELAKHTDAPAHALRISKKKVRFQATQFEEANLLIQRWLNKNNTFPDFSDIVEILKSLKLGLTTVHMHSIATSAFQAIGEYLQKRRQRELWDVLGETWPEEDPAETDHSLQEKLDANKKLFKAKEQEVIDKFVEKQLMLQKKGVTEEAESGNDDEDEEDTDSDQEQEDPLNLANGISDGSFQNESDNDSRLKKGRVDSPENVSNSSEERLLPPAANDLQGRSNDENSKDVSSGSWKQRKVTCLENQNSSQLLITLDNSNDSRVCSQVIELDYFTVHNFPPKMRTGRKVFRDRTNSLDTKPQGHLARLKKRRASQSILNDLEQSMLHITNPCAAHIEDRLAFPLSLKYKCHGTVTNGNSGGGGSSPDSAVNDSNGNSNGDAPSGDNGIPSGAGGKRGGDDGSDDDDPRRHKRDPGIEDSAEKPEDNEEEEENGHENENGLEEADNSISDKCENDAVVPQSGKSDDETNECSGNMDAIPEKRDDEEDRLHEETEKDEDKGSSGSEEADANRENETVIKTIDLSSSWKPQWVDPGDDSDELENVNGQTEDKAEEASERPASVSSQKSGFEDYDPTAFESDRSGSDEYKPDDQQSSGSDKEYKPEDHSSGSETSPGRAAKRKKNAEKRSKRKSEVSEEVSVPRKVKKVSVPIHDKLPKKNEPRADEGDDDSDGIEVLSENIVRRGAPTSESPQDRVQRFLANANNNAITITRKKAMSQETKNALNLLKGLKCINVSPATGPRQSLGNPQRSGPSGVRPLARRQSLPAPRTSNSLPVISSVQSWRQTAPRITGVRGSSPSIRPRGNLMPMRGSRLMRPNTPNRGVPMRARATLRGVGRGGMPIRSPMGRGLTPIRGSRGQAAFSARGATRGFRGSFPNASRARGTPLTRPKPSTGPVPYVLLD